MNDYRYPARRTQQQGPEPENPMKQDDHCPEALGRFYIGHYGAMPELSGGARVSSALMG